ncbi:LysE family translocator [Acinetobacter silvestris]|uniref:Lysine transporter LysE n=1 Tax=Acinetobacter silvestris TaxID=1977882 RepID=A0A1Y3CFM8_9GAMM|nr:LysE family translocator [Acinetobacter silvestris]OTG64721.1 lysine transporter LysE [Acinetobacter silvestris]
MLDLSQIFTFTLICLAMVLTPGPNMIYLISRSICQGHQAGFISLCGVAFGFIFYMLCASLGITALLMAIPYAYDAIRIGGALYLIWLAWQSFKPNGKSPFQVKNLPIDSNIRLFTMGFITNLFNPKIVMMYLSLLPQFIKPDHGSVLSQSIFLGLIQIIVSVSVNGLIVLSAGSMALFLNKNPIWSNIQRWIMGTVLASLAVKILMDTKR